MRRSQSGDTTRVIRPPPTTAIAEVAQSARADPKNTAHLEVCPAAIESVASLGLVAELGDKDCAKRRKKRPPITVHHCAIVVRRTQSRFKFPSEPTATQSGRSPEGLPDASAVPSSRSPGLHRFGCSRVDEARREIVAEDGPEHPAARSAPVRVPRKLKIDAEPRGFQYGPGLVRQQHDQSIGFSILKGSGQILAVALVRVSSRGMVVDACQVENQSVVGNLDAFVAQNPDPETGQFFDPLSCARVVFVISSDEVDAKSGAQLGERRDGLA